MKKIFAIILGTLLVMGFAASAFAIHAEIPAETQAVVAKGSTQITIGGELRIRGWYRHNFGSAIGAVMDNEYSPHLLEEEYDLCTEDDDYPWFCSVGAKTGSAAWYDYRVRLNIEAKVSPNVMAYIQLESTSGDAPDTDKWTFGQPAGNSGLGNVKPDGTPDFLQAWMLYTGSGLFGFPAGLKIGHMPLKLAYGQFFEHTQMGDDAIVFFMDPTKQWHIGLLTVKFEENDTSRAVKNSHDHPNSEVGSGNSHPNNDDLDGYVFLTTYKWNDRNTVGLNYTYLNSEGGGDSSDDLGRDTNLKMQNLGIHADGGFGNFGYQAALDLQFGSIGEGSNKADFDGWAFSTKLNYKMNNVNLRGSFAYGSGQDGDNDIEEFVPFVGNVQNFAFIYEYQHRTTAFNPSGFNPGNSSNGHAAGTANLTYYNLGIDWQATKDLSFSLDGYIFRASDTDAFEDYFYLWDVDRDVQVKPSISKNAGWEIDAKMKYQIAKGLAYQIDLGYYHIGDFYEDMVEAATWDEDSSDYAPAWGHYIKDNLSNVWVARHMLTLSF